MSVVWFKVESTKKVIMKNYVISCHAFNDC